MANAAPRPRWIRTYRALGPSGTSTCRDDLWRELPATCCFVDISGFTALSERLARRGRIGAEELTEVLNHVFSRMLEVVYAKGGALLKFGGDALLLAFADDDHARIAAEAAVAMRAVLRESGALPTSVGRVNLRMSVGIHSGTFHLFRVGDSHRELLITGPAATATTRMEQTAEAGEIVMSLDTASRLPAGAVGAPKGDGRLLRWRQVVQSGSGPTPARPVPAAVVEACVPRGLRLRFGQSGGESEHRLASVGFVKFQGVDDLIAAEGPDRTAAALDAVIRSVQRAVDLESVTFLSSDMDANGGKIILTAGVPTTQEDDEGRLLRAVRMLMDDPLPLPVKVGVNRGHVFACDIGTAYRRTFTIMGDSVNLTARLMAAAPPGEIYATPTVLDQARTQFATDTLEPFAVKGKSELVQAYRVGVPTGSKSDPYGTLPFRGRDKELATLTDALASARSGRGSSVLVEAERGAGKTRLVSEFATSAKPDHVVWMQGEAHRTGVPYASLRNAMRSLLGVDAKDRDQAGRQLLASMAQLDDQLLPFAPLLAPIVDADVPLDPADRGHRRRVRPPAHRRHRGRGARRGMPGSLLLVAEDAHWFDDTTSEICSRLAGAATSRQWLPCVIRRPDTDTGYTPSEPAGPNVDGTLVRRCGTGARSRSPPRPHLFVLTSPMASSPVPEAALSFLRNCYGSSGRPMSIRCLTPSMPWPCVRSTHCRRSPPGPAFGLGTRSILRTVPAPATPRRRIGRCRRRPAGRSPGPAHARRRRPADPLPSRVATGSLLPQPALPTAPVTAPDGGRNHRTRWGRWGRDRCHAVTPFPRRPRLEAHLAVRQNGGVCRPRGARARMRRPSIWSGPSRRRAGWATWTTDELATVYSDLGGSLELLGEYDRADDAYRNAMLAWRSDLPRRAQMAQRRAHLRSEFLGRPAAAIRQLRAARTELARDEPDAAGLRALLIAEEAAVRQRQGRLAEGLERAQRGRPRGDRRQETSAALALALDSQNTLLVRTGRQDEAIHMGRALELYEELGDGVQVAEALNHLGNTAYFGLRWNEAADFWARSAETCTAVGTWQVPRWHMSTVGTSG